VPEVSAEVPSKRQEGPGEVASQRDDFRTIALRSAGRGETRVLPIAVGGKNPLIKWKGSAMDTMSTDDWTWNREEWIDQLAVAYPDANVAVVAKSDEFLFIGEDDSAAFSAGFETFAGKAFPRTFTTSARSNRAQSYWKQTHATRRMGNVGQTSSFSVRQITSTF
jgi:Bifunctional DNA primase/polymerase, N-terminal